MQDLFPAHRAPEVRDEHLAAALAASAEQLGLQATDALLQKATQLHDVMAGRFGVMLVGPASSGKTVTYRSLRGALASIDGPVNDDGSDIACNVLNPKALTLSELYGSHNELTGDWKDGLAARLCREALARESGASWIIFDGPVDATWVESLNSALDDSCLLCLPSGERMRLDSHKMRMLFEVQDLAAASPATVSRCGMVYVPDSHAEAFVATEQASCEVDPVFESWVQALPAALAAKGNPEQSVAADAASALQQDLRAFFCKYVPHGLAWLRANASEPVLLTGRQRVSSLCAWLQQLLATCGLPLLADYSPAARVAAEYMFAFAYVWGLGGALDALGRAGWDKVVRGLFNGSANFPGGASTVYDFCCNPDRGFTFQVRRQTSAQICVSATPFCLYIISGPKADRKGR